MQYVRMNKTWQSKAKEQMRLKGIKQIDIVRKLGKSKAAVSSWFNGRHPPSIAELKEIAKMLGLSPAEMLSEDDCLARNALELDALRQLRKIPDDQLEHALALVSAVLSTLQKPPTNKT